MYDYKYKITTLEINKDYFADCYNQNPFITLGFNVDIADGVTVRFCICDFKNTDGYYVAEIEVYSETDKDENDLLKKFECNSIAEFNDGLKEQLEKWYNENDKCFY